MANTFSEITKRYETFFDPKNKWVPHGREPTQSELAFAEAGFCCVGNDIVQCPTCYIKLTKWAKTDIPMNEHRKHSPGCSFVKNWDFNHDVMNHQHIKYVKENTTCNNSIIESVVKSNPNILYGPLVDFVCKCMNKQVEELQREITLTKCVHMPIPYILSDFGPFENFN